MQDAGQANVVEVRGVVKQFPAVRALDGVSVSLRRGEVHGLVGENGAGKSTLMKIFSGVYRPTEGQLLIDGEPVELRDSAHAQRCGVAMIHQELNLVDELSVADNIFLGRERVRLGFVDRRRSEREARELLSRLECPIDPAAKVRTLSVAQKQVVEIAKALSCNARVLIMDEPTAVLSGRETTALFKLIDQLRCDGVTIVYISHILPEVLNICDRVTVMRDGQIVTMLEGSRLRATSEKELASLMVGRTMSEHFPPRLGHGTRVMMRVENLCVPGLVNAASLEVREGEILGLAGLVGAGRTELAEAIAGVRRRSAGRIFVDNEPVDIRSPRDAVRAGIAYLSEDRKGRGLTLGMGVVENTTLVSLKRYCRPLIGRRREALATMAHVDALRIKVGRLNDLIDTLSGGNQQKVLLAKWLETNPRILIVDEPTRGVDIGAKEEIYHLIQRLTRAGMACVLISSELNEILGLCHRIAVMRDGQIVAMLDGAMATEEAVMHHAAGVAAPARTMAEMSGS